MKTNTKPLHQEVYRGIRFSISSMGIGVFMDFLPDRALRWGHWSRFMEDGVYVDATLLEYAQKMRDAIDRAHADSPVFTGDIRDRTRFVA